MMVNISVSSESTRLHWMVCGFTQYTTVLNISAFVQCNRISRSLSESILHLFITTSRSVATTKYLGEHNILLHSEAHSEEIRFLICCTNRNCWVLALPIRTSHAGHYLLTIHSWFGGGLEIIWYTNKSLERAESTYPQGSTSCNDNNNLLQIDQKFVALMLIYFLDKPPT